VRARLERTILFPLAAFYCAVLLVAAWPRQLQPGGVAATLQLAATYVLARLGWPAGIGVFSGQGERPDATLRNCFRITGFSAPASGAGGGGRHILYDTMSRCREGRRDVFKDVQVGFQDRRLREAFDHLATPGAHGDRNAYPLNLLFGVADHYCHADGRAYDHLLFTGRYQRVTLASGELHDELVVEGAHHCGDGRWEVVGARQALDAEPEDHEQP
jgi:hypothetical protein